MSSVNINKQLRELDLLEIYMKYWVEKKAAIIIEIIRPYNFRIMGHYIQPLSFEQWLEYNFNIMINRNLQKEMNESCFSVTLPRIPITYLK